MVLGAPGSYQKKTSWERQLPKWRGQKDAKPLGFPQVLGLHFSELTKPGVLDKVSGIFDPKANVFHKECLPFLTFHFLLS